MAGPIILSNRLQKLYDSAGQLGDYFEGDRKLKLERERQLKLDKMAADESASGIASQAAMTEARTLENDRTKRITGLTEQLGQAETGNVMGPTQSGDFQAGLADPWSGMKDRIRAKMFTEAGTPTTSDQIKTGREGEALGRLRLSQADTRAQEAHASQLKNDEASREAGRYSTVPLSGDRVGVLNTRTGKIEDSGEIGRSNTAPIKPPRDLTDGGIKALGEQGSKLLNVHSIVNTFKPDYAGQLAGGMSNKLGKVTGGNLVGANPDQVGWWENYQGFVNQVRNDLFGAALTPGEKAEFEKTMVKPSTDPEVAKNNLLRQWDLVRGASERGAKTYAAGNVNQDQVAAAFGGVYDPATGKIGLGIDWDKRGGASGSWGDKPPANADQDSEAVQWAKQNPNDPRAREILRLNGAK